MNNRIRIYLDTNMVHDFFVNQAIYVKRGEEPKIPKKFEFIAGSKEQLYFITSFLTKAEIFRELVSAHSMMQDDIDIVWRKFLDASDCEYVSKMEFDDRLVEIVGKTQMKLRTMINFLHLFIAMDKDCYFVSGDKVDLDNFLKNHLFSFRNFSIFSLRVSSLITTTIPSRIFKRVLL